MNIQIVTVADTTYTTNSAISCTVPTLAGEITVLNRHVPLVSLLQPGVIKIIHQDQSEEYVAISTGLVEVSTVPDQDTEITILADQADRAMSLDLGTVQAAKERAEKALATPQTLSEEEYSTLLATLAMEEARIKAGAKL